MAKIDTPWKGVMVKLPEWIWPHVKSEAALRRMTIKELMHRLVVDGLKLKPPRGTDV